MSLDAETNNAFKTINDLQNEESEMIKQLQRANKLIQKGESLTHAQTEMVEALLMELEIRARERTKVVSVLERIEGERSKQITELQSESTLMSVSFNKLQEDLEKSQGRLEGSWREDGEDPDDNPTSVYDWVVDVSLISDLTRNGWPVIFSKDFYDELGDDDKSALVTSQDHCWDGAILAVVGLYNKGKSYVLNRLTDSNLPCGKKVSTKGLSFKHIQMDKGSDFVLLDSAGSYSPVKVDSDLSVAEKEATEWFLLDLIFELSDYFICVVNDFTSLDQRYLDRLTRSLQNSNKCFKEVIVVHNMKEVTSAEVFKHVWKTQVTGIYSGGQEFHTKVAARNSASGEIEERTVTWFKTPFSRHVALANEDSRLGVSTNPWSISLLKYWLKSVFVPVNRKFSVVRNVVEFTNKKLSGYFNQPLKLALHPGEGPYNKFIKPVSFSGGFRLPQISLDASGLMLTRPDSFTPAVDILQGDEYQIFMDVPGMTADDITVSRQNVITIIKGTRKLPYTEDDKESIEKRERKYGEFTMTFKIPHQYNRKWSSIDVTEGVLCIRFARDMDDEEVSAKA